MIFNKNINGYKNEHEFSMYLNGKKVKLLNPIFRDLIDELYNYPNEQLTISARVDYTKSKFDLIIIINKIIKRISIKKGVKNSVHVESIASFIHFLIQNKVSKEVIIEYLKYHYSDGTTNGKGKVRMSVEKYKLINQNKIDFMNKELNSEVLLEKAIDRFILIGKNSCYKIDALIHGVVEDFIWISREDIRKNILSKKDDYSTSVHFGPLTCQPMNRCLNYNPIYDDKRFYVQIKWYNISDDIIENMNNRCIHND